LSKIIGTVNFDLLQLLRLIDPEQLTFTVVMTSLKGFTSKCLINPKEKATLGDLEMCF
jgi:hypothetical protein